MIRIDRTITEYDHLKSIVDSIFGITTQTIKSFFQRIRLSVRSEIGLQGFCLKNSGVYTSDLF